MTEGPSNREIDRLLARLPRESASPGFSRRVIAGLERSAPPPSRRGWLLAAAAAAVALVAGLWLLPRTQPGPSPEETLALQEEHRQLVAELEALKSSLRRSQAPVLYLGGTERVDLVLDLQPVWQAEAGVLPAVHGGAERPRPATRRRVGERR